MTDEMQVCPKCGAAANGIASPYGDSWDCGSRIVELSRSLQTANAEIERLTNENEDYKIGVQRNTRRLTELANKLGLEGTMFKEYGYSQFEQQLASRNRDLSEAVGLLRQCESRCTFPAGTLIVQKDVEAFLDRLDTKEKQL